MVRIIVNDLNNPRRGTQEFEGASGSSILEICEAHPLKVELNHACGGFCSCTTCHVVIDEGAELLSEKEEDEEDRLEMLEQLKPSSRLGCQARLSGNEGRLVLTIPEVEY